MKNRIRKSLALIGFAAAFILGTSVLQGADAQTSSAFQGVLDSMFENAAVSAPQPIQTEDRFGFSGGYAEVRAPISNVNLVSFVPPNISGGCGGINLYLGSFSFINGQEFEALLRDIGQDAIGYAFKLAIENMCPSCESVLDDLSDAIQQMNNTLKNTCQLAEGLDDWIDPSADPNSGEHLQAIQGAWDAAKNDISDAFTAFQNLNGNPSSSTQTASAETPAAPTTSPSIVDNPLIGNMTWKALTQNGAIRLLSTLGQTDTTSQEILMSLLGTTIIEPEPSQQEAQNCGNSQTGCEGQTHSFPSTLDLNALVNGPADTEATGTAGQYLTCLAWSDEQGNSYPATGQPLSCMSLSEAALSSTGFQGIAAIVDTLMFGGAPGVSLNTAIGATTNTPGLVPLVTTGSPLVQNGARPAAFVNMLPVPLYTDLLAVQSDPNEVAAIAKSFEPYIVDYYASELGEAIITTAENTFIAQNNVTPPTNFDQTLSRLRSETDHYASEAQGIWQLQAEVLQVIKAERAAMVPQDH